MCFNNSILFYALSKLTIFHVHLNLLGLEARLGTPLIILSVDYVEADRNIGIAIK